MLISYFGKTKEGKFEFKNIDYPSLASPVTRENHREFKERLDKIKKARSWTICMFNPIPEYLQKQTINDQKAWE